MKRSGHWFLGRVAIGGVLVTAAYAVARGWTISVPAYVPIGRLAASPSR